MTSRKNMKKRISTVTAVLLAAAMLLGATYAWRDTRQHKSNLFGAKSSNTPEGMETRDVSLNNLFTPPSVWTWSEDAGTNISTPNNLTVTNLTSSTTHVFARITLKEYMELRRAQEGDVYTDAQGKEILVATWASGENKGQFMTLAEAQSIGFNNYGSLEVIIGYSDTLDPITGERIPIKVTYATTNNTELRNGIYGKPMPRRTLEIVWGEVPKAAPSHGPQTPGEGECTYTPVINGITKTAGNLTPETGDDLSTPKAISEYVSIDWNTAKTFKDWANTSNGDWVEEWIFDDLAASSTGTGEQEGWVYWGKPILPGESTDTLINSVSTIGGSDPLNILPAGVDGIVDYVLHSDMEAVSGFTEFVDDLPVKSEVDDLFTPTLPLGTDTGSKAGRTAFFAEMNNYEHEEFEDRGTMREGNRIVRYYGSDDAAFKTDTNAKTTTAKRVVVKEEDQFVHTYVPAPNFQDVDADDNTYDYTFIGWASNKTNAADGTPDVTRYQNGSFSVPGVDLTNEFAVTRLYAVYDVVVTPAP